MLYIQRGLEGTPEVLIDPNAWSADGTVRLAGYEASKDGTLLAYAVSRSGSDWQELNVLDLATRKPLADKVEWVKVSDIAWRDRGFYYSRYPTPAKGKELSSVNENHQVFYHRVGTPQAEDTLVFEDPKNPQRFHTVSTTEDERFAVLTVSDRGTGKQGNAVFVQDLSKAGSKFTPLIPEIGDDTYDVLESVRGELLVFTDNDAPNGRVVRIDPASPAPANWKVIIPPKADTIDSIAVAGGKVIATYMKDVASRAYVHNLEGTLENEIELPGLGSAGGFGGNMDDASLFYTFTSFTYPTSIFRYDVAARKSAMFRAPEIPGLDVNQYETKQVFVTSKDGAKVPMFLVHKKGIALDGNNPTLMYGYGGFNIATTPGFNSLRIALLEQGFVYASVNMRGGSEYGEAWHDAGTKAKKQNVFDDFIAAAEWLIANKYTVAGAAGGAGRLERRPAGGRRHQPAAGAVPRGDSAGRRHGHAAVPQVHDRLELDRRLRLERQRRGVQGALRLLTAPQHQDRRQVSRDAHHHRRSRRPGRPRALVQVRRDAAEGRERGEPGADPDRDQVGAWRQQRHQADRGHRGHLRVHHAQHGDHAEVLGGAIAP